MISLNEDKFKLFPIKSAGDCNRTENYNRKECAFQQHKLPILAKRVVVPDLPGDPCGEVLHDDAVLCALGRSVLVHPGGAAKIQLIS